MRVSSYWSTSSQMGRLAYNHLVLVEIIGHLKMHKQRSDLTRIQWSSRLQEADIKNKTNLALKVHFLPLWREKSFWSTKNFGHAVVNNWEKTERGILNYLCIWGAKTTFKLNVSEKENNQICTDAFRHHGTIKDLYYRRLFCLRNNCLSTFCSYNCFDLNKNLLFDILIYIILYLLRSGRLQESTHQRE